MKQFNRVILSVFIIGLGLIILFTSVTLYPESASVNNSHIIEANRIADLMQDGVLLKDIAITQDSSVEKLEWLEANADAQQIEHFFNGAGVGHGVDFFIKPLYDDQQLSGYLRLTYAVPNSLTSLIVTGNTILILALASILFLLIYLKRNIIAPFHALGNMPLELAKGHLSQDMKEGKNRYFGRFVWGLELLRETLATQKQTNVKMEKERQTLIASLSHELKTPISSIKLYAAALYDNLYEDREKQRESAKLIEQKSQQIEGIIGDIITSSSSSLSDFEVENSAFYLREWLEKVTQSNAEKLALLKIHLDIKQPDDKLLLGDMERLVEVFDNIIENAIKYGDGNYIRVTFYEEDYRQLIRIENSGTPISQNELAHIFTSFWRGSNVADKQGNGLGLYKCKQLLRKMDGDIFAETEEQAVAIVLVVRF